MMKNTRTTVLARRCGAVLAATAGLCLAAPAAAQWWQPPQTLDSDVRDYEGNASADNMYREHGDYDPSLYTDGGYYDDTDGYDYSDIYGYNDNYYGDRFFDHGYYDDTYDMDPYDNYDYMYGDAYDYDYYDDYGYDYGYYDDFGYDYTDPYAYDYYGYDYYDVDEYDYYDTYGYEPSQRPAGVAAPSQRRGQMQQDRARQARMQADSGQRQGQARSDRQHRAQAGKAELRGQLESWTRANLQGQRDAHTLVRLRLENGRSAVVNLGPNVSLQQLDLDQGDRIAVYGSRSTINDRDVLMAEKLRIGDRVLTMRGSAQEQGQRQAQRQSTQRTTTDDRAQRASGQRLMLRGELEDAQRVTLEGQREANTLVRVRLEDGQRVTVNLGPNVSLATLSDMNVSMGNRVLVWGHRRTVSGRPVIVAERVRVGDESMTLDWQGQSRRTSRR